MEAKQKFDEYCGLLHHMRPLIMHDIPACGLTPDKRAFSPADHKVGLVYASAVPVNSYLNNARNDDEWKLHARIAEANLVGQYFGALQQIADLAKEQGAKRKVYLLPLGGGVFNNPWESIAMSMAQAVELLASQEPKLFDRLEVEALAWSGNPSEQATLQRLLDTQ